jgi:hypothetical protein
MKKIKGRKRAIRRPAVQVELDLPPPPGGYAAPELIEVEHEWWQARWLVVSLAAAAALLLALTIAARVESHRDRKSQAALEKQVRTLTLRPSTELRALRVNPNPVSWSATPDATLRWPEPPEFLDIYLPVAYSDFKSFAVTIDKVDAGRMLDVQRLAPDSNRELRLSLNSSAFGPGEYRLRLQGYTWRGERVDAGWVRLLIQPPG